MSQNPATTRLVPVERLSAITSLIAEGAVFDGNFHTTRDQGIKVDGLLKGNITFESGGTLHVGATGVIENTRLEADYVFIEGKVIGTVIARKALEITGSATLLGDASYDEMIDMHPRARVRGKIEYRGDIDAAPHGPFDGATSLLTFHFIPRDQRFETLRAIRQRLKAGAPFVVMHISIPSSEPDRSLWLSRHRAFAGTPAASAEQSMQA